MSDRMTNIFAKMQEQFGVGETNTTMKRVMTAGLRDGCRDALSAIRNAGRDLAMAAFGVKSDWGRMEFHNNSMLRDNMREALADQYNESLEDILAEVRKKGLFSQDETDELIRMTIKDQKWRIERAIRDQMDDMAKELIYEQTDEIKVAMGRLLEKDGGTDAVAAEIFSQLVNQDEEYLKSVQDEIVEESRDIIADQLFTPKEKAAVALMEYLEQNPGEIDPHELYEIVVKAQK